MKRVELIRKGVCWCAVKFNDEVEFNKYKQQAKQDIKIKDQDPYWLKFKKAIQTLQWDKIDEVTYI